MNGKRTLVTAMTLAVVAGSVALAPAASAKDGEVRASGSCTGATGWKMKAKPDNGRIEVEVEIDSNKVGQTWSVVIKDNAVQVFSGSRVTLAPSGSFSVEKRVANRAGTDSFVAVAKNAKTGEKCTARVSL